MRVLLTAFDWMIHHASCLVREVDEFWPFIDSFEKRTNFVCCDQAVKILEIEVAASGDLYSSSPSEMRREMLDLSDFDQAFEFRARQRTVRTYDMRSTIVTALRLGETLGQAHDRVQKFAAYGADVDPLPAALAECRLRPEQTVFLDENLELSGRDVERIPEEVKGWYLLLAALCLRKTPAALLEDTAWMRHLGVVFPEVGAVGDQYDQVADISLSADAFRELRASLEGMQRRAGETEALPADIGSLLRASCRAGLPVSSVLRLFRVAEKIGLRLGELPPTAPPSVPAKPHHWQILDKDFGRYSYWQTFIGNRIPADHLARGARVLGVEALMLLDEMRVYEPMGLELPSIEAVRSAMATP